MAVRAAKYADIPEIVGLMKESYDSSIYADKATFDDVEAKQLCVRMMQRHGQVNYGGSLFLVSEKRGRVLGFIIGILDNVYPCLKELMVTDLGFFFSKEAAARDAVAMIGRLIKWAKINPKVLEVHLGVTNAIGDWSRVATLYEKIGFTQCGAMFQMRISHE